MIDLSHFQGHDQATIGEHLGRDYPQPIAVGDIVCYADPIPGEDSPNARYVVREVNGDRCFIEFITDKMIIKPVTLARTAELRDVYQL